MKREKIIFLTQKDPRSKRDWSGIPFYMFQALQEIYDVEYLPGPKLAMTKRVLYYVSRFLGKLTNTKFVLDYGKITAWLFARHYTRKLAGRNDAKFVFVPAGLTEICLLNTALPIVAVGDCSILQLIDYYPSLKNVSVFSREDLEQVERAAFAKCSRIIFSSEWASDFTRKHYGRQCATVPFGANLSFRETSPKRMRDRECRLLAVGVDWLRKGGDTVIEIHRKLLNQNLQSSLTIVGMKPEQTDNLPGRVQFKFVDKDSDDGEREYFQLLRESDFLVLPTIADCTPIVIAEAFAAGLPVLSTRTGGIPSMVEDGVTGFLFEPGDANAYAAKIGQLLTNSNDYETLSSNCLAASRNVFNWQRWALKIQKLCATL